MWCVNIYCKIVLSDLLSITYLYVTFHLRKTCCKQFSALQVQNCTTVCGRSRGEPNCCLLLSLRIESIDDLLTNASIYQFTILILIMVMNGTKPLRALALFAILSTWTTTITVQGQRLKEGCYAAGKLSCDNPRQIDAARELGLDVNKICYQIEVDYLKSKEIVWDSSLHAEYINGIESDTEICSHIQIAYSQCLFCAQEAVVDDCVINAEITKCGDQPTLEEVLQNDTVYAEFRTKADIDAVCEALEIAYKDDFPSSLELCDKQKLVKHLCPGYCDGGCFDAELYPPTCDPDAFQGDYNDTLVALDVCNTIRDDSFFFVGSDTIMNISKHLDFLKAIPADNENTTYCKDAQQSYSQCAWCSDEKCFNDLNPPSCKAPSENATGLDLEGIDEESLCMALYDAFYDIEYPDDLYNYSKHAAHLHVLANTSICEQAKKAYHTCYWCVPDVVDVDFCDDPCSSNVSLPEDHVSGTLMNLNISHSEAELNCDEIFDYRAQPSWLDPYSLRECYDDIFLARLCPNQFCSEAYLGATTTAQKRALIWMSRVAAILTFFGAGYIIYDTVSDKNKLKTVYHRLLIGMAVFDLVTAVAWSFATAPIDKTEAWMEGAVGNEATCTAQAFFIQLGFTSVFYNVSLALYYVFVVALGWRESQLKAIQGYMIFVPPVVGLGLAFGGITSYDWLEYGCHLLPPPGGDLWVVLVFVVLPLGLSIAAITASMFIVYCKVRRQVATTRKWSFGVSKASALEQQVFWQALYYVISFYITVRCFLSFESLPLYFSPNIFLANACFSVAYSLQRISSFR